MAGYKGFDDLDDGLTAGEMGGSVKQATSKLHGGEREFNADCPRCKGSGRWQGYRYTFTCKKCGGTGKVTKGVAAAAKGKETKARNLEAWLI